MMAPESNVASIATQNTRGQRQPERVRVPAGSVLCLGVDVHRLDTDDAGEPRVVEGTAVIVGRAPQLEDAA
jgi:hypothetical protein